MLKLRCPSSTRVARYPLKCFSTSLQRNRGPPIKRQNRAKNGYDFPFRDVKDTRTFSRPKPNRQKKRSPEDLIVNEELKEIDNEGLSDRKIHTSEAEEVYAAVDSILKSKFFQSIRKQEQESKNLKTIVSEELKRFDTRFQIPTQRWVNKIHGFMRETHGVERLDNLPLVLLMEKYLGKPKFHVAATEFFDALDIGDAVEFSTTLDQSVMSVIVQLPSKDDDPRYTVMDRKGTLHFCEKSAFKLRIPKLIPKLWIKDIVEKTDIDSSGYASVMTTVDHQYELYTVNPLARRTIVAPLLEVTNQAWENLPDVSLQLEVFHRMFQGKGPTQVSLFQIYHAVEKVGIKEMKGVLASSDQKHAYSAMSKNLAEIFGSDFKFHQDEILGKGINPLKPEALYDVPLLYSIILALKKQNTLWSTLYTSRSAMLPISVTVNPIGYVHRIESAVDLLKRDTGLKDRFISYIEKRDFTKIPRQFDQILFLLKEYSVGNVTDAVSESVICQLTKAPKDLHKTDVTRTNVYDLLSEIGYIDTKYANPLHFSNNLLLPGKNVSTQADREQNYYEYCEVDKDFDISKDVRKDFGDMRVYCIDAETAHEIDDGVAIERIDEQNAVIHIHIADPASYLTPELTISKIAFERAFTTYQPETISAMLPMSLVNISGLGIEGQKTRAITFSVPFNFKTGKIDLSKAEVNPSYVSRFPKYTYNTVDQTLLRSRDQKDLNDEEKDLNDLFKVAQGLRKSRIEQGAIIFGEAFGAEVRVLPKDEKEAKSNALFIDSSTEDYDIVFGKQKSTDSQLLVSELMILANTISGLVLKKNGYSGIYKGMKESNLNGTAATVISNMNQMIKEGSLPMMKDIAKSIKFISPAVYTHEPTRHLMLACDTYAPSTSPLRRFGDLINHWQFHNIAKNEKSRFTEAQMLYMTQYIEVRNDILKSASRRAGMYYCIKYMSDQIEKGNTLKMSFFTWSKPSGPYIQGIIPEFGLFARLKLSRDCRPPKVGSTITNFEIEALDAISGSIELKQIPE